MNDSLNNTTAMSLFNLSSPSTTSQIDSAIFLLSNTFSSFAILLNLIYIAVFVDKTMDETIYKYLLANSLGGLFLSASSFLTNIALWTMKQATNNSFVLNMLILYEYIYCAKAINMMISLNDIFISIDRYFILNNSANSSTTSRHAYLHVILNFFLGLLVFLPLVLSYRVENFKSSNIVRNDFGNSQLGHGLVLACTLGQQLVIILAMCAISIVLMLKFREYVVKRNNLLNVSKPSIGNITNEIPLQPIGTSLIPKISSILIISNAKLARRVKRAERKQLIMVMYMILANFASNCPISIYYIFQYLISSVASDVSYFFGSSVRFWFVLPSVLNFFIYYFLNKKFSRILKRKFKIILNLLAYCRRRL